MKHYNQCNKVRLRKRSSSLTNTKSFAGHNKLSSAPVRKLSTSSTDSCDSDGHLCTEELCVMDSKKRLESNIGLSQAQKPVPKDVLRRTSSSHVLRNESMSNQVDGQHNSGTDQTLGKHCKSCGGEMLKIASPELPVSSYPFRSWRRMLTSCVPCWLSEPEFMVHPKPRDKIHNHADSLFSTSSGFTNYHGILNLCFILLVLGNARLFLENIIKYGILINLSFTKWFFHEPYNWPNLLLTLSIAVYPAIALATEKALAKNVIGNRTGLLIYILNLSVLLFLPAVVIYVFHPIIVFSLITLGTVTTCFLKLISYAHVNYWCRELYATDRLKRRASCGSMMNGNQDTDGSCMSSKQTYPDNLNIRDLTYFMCAPTLCYELNFPRSARIRKRFLAKRLLEMVFLCWLLVALTQQWIVPAVNNARQPLAEMEAFKMLERLLKLSIPNHLMWLVFFYWFFHSSLNVIAELLRFADREFYKDWWNAETVSEFWQNWNVPVHRFATRHVYKPLLRRGVPKLAAATVVFLFSAFFHEVSHICV
ncbi:unnamed protein product, partial [Candidula unifasciata]